MPADTVITCFPEPWGQSNAKKARFDSVLDSIEQYLRLPGRRPITSVYDLATVIINECLQVFGRLQVPNEDLSFLDIFDASISDIVCIPYTYRI